MLWAASSAWADNTQTGANLPGPITRWALSAESQRVTSDARQPGRPTATSAVVLQFDDTIRGRGVSLTWGVSLGAMQSAATPSPGASMGALFRARAGGAMDLFGWNMVWPGELLLTAQAEVFADGRDVLFEGTRAAAFLGLRLLAGYGDALRMALDLEVAPTVFGSGPADSPIRTSMGRARLSFGLKRVQIGADVCVSDGEALQQGAWRSVRAVRAGLSLVVGLGGE